MCGFSSAVCHSLITGTNLMGLWRCCLAWVRSSDSHNTCPPRRCPLVFQIKPSSHTSPGLMVWVESARTPAGITGERSYGWSGVNKWIHGINVYSWDVKEKLWPTDLSSSQDVVPHWSASKVNVEICEAALHAHETVPTGSQGRTWHTMQILAMKSLWIGLRILPMWIFMYCIWSTTQHMSFVSEVLGLLTSVLWDNASLWWHWWSLSVSPWGGGATCCPPSQ